MKRYYLILLALYLVVSSGIAHAQIITTMAGTGTAGYNGTGMPAVGTNIDVSYAVILDTFGNVYISDYANYCIRKVSATTGIMTIVAGTPKTAAFGITPDGTLATAAAFGNLGAIAVDDTGNLYVGDNFNNVIYKVVKATGLLYRIAGLGYNGFNGDGIPALNAYIAPEYMIVDHSGNLYISDPYQKRVRKITAATGLISTVIGTGASGYNGDGIPGNTAEIMACEGLCLDKAGNLYLAEYLGGRVRKVSAATGLISTVAGTGVNGNNGNGILATAAQLGYPSDVKIDDTGNIYIVEWGHNGATGNYVRKVSASTGLIGPVAGQGYNGYNGDGIPAVTALLSYPSTMAIDKQHNIYIDDANNFRIREIFANACTSITAGNGILARTKSICTSGSDTLSLVGATTGTSGIQYQWQSSTNGTSWTNVGLNSLSFITGTITTTTYYRVVVTCVPSGLHATSAIDTFTIIQPLPSSVSISANTSDTVCVGSSVILTAIPTNGGATPVYQWFRNGVAVGTNSNVFTDTVNNAQDVIMCRMTSSNCVSPLSVTGTKTLTTIPIAIVGITVAANPGDTICAGTPVRLIATTVNGGTSPIYQWTKNGTVVSSSKSYLDNSAGNNRIICTVTSSLHCVMSATASDTINIVAIPLMTPLVAVNVSPGNNVCPGTSVLFTATPTNGGTNPVYQWTKNDNLVNNSGATYTDNNILDNEVVICTMASNNTCLSAPTGADTVTMHLYPKPVIAINTAPNACTDVPLSVSATPVTNDISHYKWNFEDGTIVMGKDAGPYGITWSNVGIHTISVIAFSDHDCPSDAANATIDVHVADKPEINVAFPVNFCVGDSVVMSVSNYNELDHYQWSPKEFFSNGDLGNNVIATVTIPQTNISVTLTDTFGCQSTDTVFTNAQVCCQVYFPTAFTPNGDGKNDVFRPITIGAKNVHKLVIVNRWGQQVFSGINGRLSWDGTINGVPAEIGTYNWYIEYDCNDKTIIGKGDVTLIR